ncbi:MAG TPA: HlyD family efflux transporter periplasmic adaptor subunit [Vicinamibacterales bacterium]|jgi:HlyD family secretion protein|nr:HlyD family efflux transporter periplasmic adaptor subunit [Vicinamibacterales bacterium]
MRAVTGAVLGLALISVVACQKRADAVPRASGYVEATEVRVAAEAAGRVIEMLGDEGKRVAAGDVLARVDATDLELTLRRTEADRDQAAAQLRLLQAGARPEDIRQASAQAESAHADVAATDAELKAASEDLRRFEALLVANAGSRKQRDDAATRVSVATSRVAAARERARAADEAAARLRAGSRREEIAAAQARVAAVGAQVAAVQENIADATVKAPVGGTITSKLVDTGETVARGTPVAVISDLDHAWANVYVDEPVVPTLRLGQPATLVTDAGQQLTGTITYISPRAEFTPRNVQTAEERSKLVYRVKVTVDNREGILKPGMPVEATFGGR